MIEKVNPSHPDKVADRIAGAIVDLAYSQEENPKIAVEVLIGHGTCTIIAESSVDILAEEIYDIVCRIAEPMTINFILVPQDKHLAKNQSKEIRCGDNGIFKGVPLTTEEKELSKIARFLYDCYGEDGKYILDKDKLIVCQSNATNGDIKYLLESEFGYKNAIVNPLGEWTGGTNVDSGATNRKLGSDMAQSITGGGLHGKDLSKADVSVNIYAFLKAQELKHKITASCAIGDTNITFNTADELEKNDSKYTFTEPYSKIVEVAKDYIKRIGGFEKFAEWGLF